MGEIISALQGMLEPITVTVTWNNRIGAHIIATYLGHSLQECQGAGDSLSFSDDLGQCHKCRSAPVTCPMPRRLSPIAGHAASFHECHESCAALPTILSRP
jgi:hypothetical protein